MAKGAASASGGGGAAPEAQQQLSGGGDTPRRRRPTRSRSDPLLIVCRCFNVVTAATAALCVAVNVLSAVQSFRTGLDVRRPLPFLFVFPAMARLRADLGCLVGLQIFGGIFRCYAVVISLFVGVVETEWGFIMKFCKVLLLPSCFARHFSLDLHFRCYSFRFNKYS
jgi:hypothetical protein